MNHDLNADDLNITDRSDMDNDEDRIFYSKIGKTEIQVDKVLSNLLVFEVFCC